VAASGHDAIHDLDSGAERRGRSVRHTGQDDAGALAVPQGRFTLLFERFAVEVLLACASVSQHVNCWALAGTRRNEIMKRAVERGLERGRWISSSIWDG